MSAYGSKLDPYRKLREPLGVKGIRQSVVVTNNPSTIDQNQQLLVRFPNLSTNDVIVPRTARLAFTIELTSKDPNATVYQNLGRAIVKKTTIKISGNEVMSIDDSDIFHCYVDLWRSPSERLNMVYQGIGKSNMLKHRVGAGNDMVTDSELARQIRQQFSSRMAILYDRILRHRKITKKKSDTLWDINLNVPARNMKGILMLFEDPDRTSTEDFVNPNITKVEMTIEGVPNQLYSQGMRQYQQWDEINKYFALTSKRDKETDKVAKDLYFSDTNIAKYLTKRFALWLDLRSTDDNTLHGSGRRIENASEGITIQIEKEQGPDENLNIYLFIIQDAQINFEDGRFSEIKY